MSDIRRELSGTTITAINALPNPARSVMRMRYGIGQRDPQSLSTVAEHMGMTRLEVRRIEADAVRAIGSVA